ncbi:MAG: 50S ribosomal protein L6 [Alphaproteobacteria bacterium]|nr:50S ribosomal protein L6 [Alphaproteobacteria bacterium]
MSRVGLIPVEVPSGTQVTVSGQTVSAKGKLGQMSYSVSSQVEIAQEDNLILLKPRGNSKNVRAIWGTSRSHIQNMVQGVSEGFGKKLIIIGTGYRAAVQGKILNLQLGYSHDINFPIPEGIQINCPDQTTIEINGADKQQVGQVAAEIRGFRKPEPYKGKGIRYEGEQILRKEGKKK